MSEPNATQDNQGYTQNDSELSAEATESEEDRERRIRKCLQDADDLKQEGNSHFKLQEWPQALAKYTSGLGRLPKRRKQKPETTTPPPKDAFDPDPEAVNKNEASSPSSHQEKECVEEDQQDKPLEGIDLECAKARSVLNSNIGACHLRLEEYKAAVEACTEALADEPEYIKALQRRATCNEKIGSWSSLASAQDDYNKLLKLYPPNSPQVTSTRRTLEALKPRVEAAQQKETSEVLDKLKGFGNSILGNFGLSTDNFKFEPNGQGGYSMNFVQ